MKYFLNIHLISILTISCFFHTAINTLDEKFEKCPNEHKLEAQFDLMNQRLTKMEQYLEVMATLMIQKEEHDLKIKQAKIAQLEEEQAMQDVIDSAPWYLRYGTQAIDVTQTIVLKILLPIILQQIAHQLANKTLHYVGEKTDYVLGDVPERFLPTIISSFVASRPHEWLFMDSDQRVTNKGIRKILRNPQNKKRHDEILQLEKNIRTEEFEFNLENKFELLSTRLDQLRNDKKFQEDELRQLRNAHPTASEDIIQALWRKEQKIKATQQANTRSEFKQNTPTSDPNAMD